MSGEQQNHDLEETELFPSKRDIFLGHGVQDFIVLRVLKGAAGVGNFEIEYDFSVLWTV